MANSFRIPRFGDQYINQITDRVGDLISQNLWDGLKTNKLKAWLTNFQTDDDRYFAACVLDALVYRSASQTVALATQLFQRSLVDLTRTDPAPLHLAGGWLEPLCQDATDPGVRLVAVTHSDDPPTKSSYLIGRMLKRDLRVKERWILNAEDFGTAVTGGVKQFIFIDDFLGTGHQFEEFSTDIGLPNVIASTYCVYAPLVAHSHGVTHLSAKVPGLRIAAAERLLPENSLFHPTRASFEDGTNTPQAAETFYYDLLQRMNISLQGVDRLGYGGMGLTFGFEHAVPDNSLPLLWWNKTSTFKPLLDR